MSFQAPRAVRPAYVTRPSSEARKMPVPRVHLDLDTESHRIVNRLFGIEVLDGGDTGDNDLVLRKLLSTNGKSDRQDSWHGNWNTTNVV